MRLLVLFLSAVVIFAQLAPVGGTTVPTTTSWWPVIGAISAGVIGPIGLISALAIWFVRSTVETAILKANAQQLKELESKYVPAMNSSITGREIEQILSESSIDLEKMREDFKELELYAHTKVHDINNMLQKKPLHRDTAPDQ